MPLQGDKILGDLNEKLQKSIDLMTKLVKIQNDYNVAVKAAGGVKSLNDETKKLNQNVAQLNKVQKQLTQTTDEEVKAKLRFQKASQDQKKALKDEIVLNDKYSGSLEKAKAANKKLQREKESLDLSNKKSIKRLRQINKEQDRNNKTIAKASNQLQKQKINIGNYASSLGPLGAGLQKINAVFKLLIANPIVALFAALAAAVTGLIKLFKDTDDGGTLLEAKFKGLASITDVLKTKLDDLAGVLKLIFTGKFRQAIAQSRDLISEIGAEFEETRKKVEEYVFALDKLEDRITANISSQAELQKRFREFAAAAKDQTLTEVERIKNLKKAQDAAEEFYSTLRKEELERFNLEVKNAAARISLTEDELKAFILLNGQQAEEARATNEKIAEAWNVLGDERIKGIEEQLVKATEAETQYFKRTGELISLRTGLEKKLNTDLLKEQEEYLELKEEKEEEFLKVRKDEEELLFDEELDLLDKQMAADNKALNEKIENDKKKAQSTLDRAKKEEEIEKQKIDAINKLATEGLIFANSLYDRQVELTQRKVEKGVISEEEGAKKIAEIQRKQAILNKSTSLADIAINTAVAISRIWRDVPKVDFGISTGILTGLAIASGVAQAATVLAQPLPEVPSFFTGGTHKGGLAEVHGGEVIQTDKGNFLTNWGKYEGKLIDLPESNIIPNKEVINNDLYNITKKGDMIELKTITKKEMYSIMDNTAGRFENAIKNQPQPITQDRIIGWKKQNQWIMDKSKRYN